MLAIKKILDSTEKLILFLMVLLMCVALLVIGVQVFTRYVMNNSTPWSEELARYANVISALMVMGIATRSEEHIRMDFLDYNLSAEGRNILSLISLILEGIFIVFIFISILKLLPVAARQTTPGLRIPISVIFLISNVGVFTAIVFCLERICYRVLSISIAEAVSK